MGTRSTRLAPFTGTAGVRSATATATSERAHDSSSSWAIRRRGHSGGVHRLSETAKRGGGAHWWCMSTRGCAFIDVTVRPTRPGASLHARKRVSGQSAEGLAADLGPESPLRCCWCSRTASSTPWSTEAGRSPYDVHPDLVVAECLPPRALSTTSRNKGSSLRRSSTIPRCLAIRANAFPRTSRWGRASTPERRRSRPLQVPRAIEAQVLRSHPGVVTFSPIPLLCNHTICPLELWGNLVYDDTTHLSVYADMEDGTRATSPPGALP